MDQIHQTTGIDEPGRYFSDSCKGSNTTNWTPSSATTSLRPQTFNKFFFGLRFHFRRLWWTHPNIFRGLIMALLLVKSNPEWNLWSLLPPRASNRQSKEKIHRNSRFHLGWHFRMLFQSSKLKAQSSNVSFATFQWNETFGLWALRFRKCHLKWDWLYYCSR